MSLHALAHTMASKGRGPDSMLVHMAPREVAGLHALAKAHGGALTTNPDTGLPEAGFLSSLLPTLIGAGLSVASGGTLTPMMAAMMTGGGYGLMTGSLNKGLMAGLGAFGGAGLGSGLLAAGAEGVVPAIAEGTAGTTSAMSGGFGAGVPAAATAAEAVAPAATQTVANAGTTAAMQGGFGAGAPSVANAGTTAAMQGGFGAGAPATLADTAVATATPMAPPVAAPAPVVAAPPTAPTFSDNFARAGQGIQNLGSKEGLKAFMGQEASKGVEATGIGGSSGLLKHGMAALLPPMMQQEKNTPYKGSGPNPYNYSYSANRRKDPNEGYEGPASGERRWFDPVYTSTPMAAGGLTAFAGGGMNNLGGYSDGGHLLKGPGDGVSDSIPATIGDRQPARLADGEFVVPARIVSELGNGSTEAGARRLYKMMDRVQQARGKTTGKGKVAVNSRAEKALPV